MIENVLLFFFFFFVDDALPQLKVFLSITLIVFNSNAEFLFRNTRGFKPVLSTY